MTRQGIQLNSEAIREFCKKWKIKQLSVFGSILSDDFGPDSDVDFLVDYEDDEEWNLFDDLHMREELEAILGRRVDLVDRYAIETAGNRFIKKDILGTAEPVYGQR